MTNHIVDAYINYVCNLYMQTHPNANKEKALQMIEDYVIRNIKDIPCVLHNNVTHQTLNSSMLKTFEWISDRNPIVTGNGTFFKQHSEYLSPSINFLETTMGNRDKAKHKMYEYQKGTSGYVNNYNTQLNLKKIMNADYGGSGTVYSPFYSMYIPPATTATAKNITTTLICCLEFSSGNNNPWSKCNNINELFDMIRIVMKTDDSDRELIISPISDDELLQHLISKANNISISDSLVLKSFIKSLSEKDKSKLMNAFNVKRVVSEFCKDEIAVIMDYFKQHQLDVNNITEESLYNAGFGKKPPECIASHFESLAKKCCDNCIYPYMLNDAEVRANNMQRVIVCVTDTDSLMVHFASYVDTFQARVSSHKKSCMLASAVGTRLFVNYIIPKFVEYIANGMNIQDKKYRDKFIFKNEFGFLAQALFAKKMYASSQFVQEGSPRNVHNIEFTGLSFKKRDAAEFLEPIMTRLYDKYVLTDDNVNVEALLNEYFSLRSEMKNEINTTTKFHKQLSLKEISAYDPNRVLPDQARGAIVWNNIMPDEEMLPMDRVFVIPLTFELLEEHKMDDPRTAEILRLNLIGNENKKYDPVICLPEKYKEIPNWIGPCVNVEGSLDKLLTPFKQLLGLFDIYLAETKSGMIPSRMVYL